MERYKEECEQLRELALRQLNLEKNAKKGHFENLKIYDQEKIDLFSLLEDEISELKDELLDDSDSCYNLECECGGNDLQYKQKIKINYERALAEIGDCAAVLVGLIAKLNSMERSK